MTISNSEDTTHASDLRAPARAEPAAATGAAP